ncbi:hypothetical protein F5B17DRAFT_433421 [Nemania serpens]|nr:hypothetical protein F5B17DRAFT_433421 [Nemania serpens]
MKATIAFSTLASLPLAALVSAFEVPGWEKMSLRDALCKNVHLTDKYVLNADCTNPYDPPPLQTRSISLDLNKCFANYLGTLNYVQDGGFGASCDECHLEGGDAYNLVCQCDMGDGTNKNMNTTYKLGDWKTVRIEGCAGCQYCGPCNLNPSCHSSDYIEKRSEDKKARNFLA